MEIADSLSSRGNLAFNRRTSSSTIKDINAGKNFVTIWGSNLGSRNTFEKKEFINIRRACYIITSKLKNQLVSV